MYIVNASENLSDKILFSYVETFIKNGVTNIFIDSKNLCNMIYYYYPNVNVTYDENILGLWLKVIDNCLLFITKPDNCYSYVFNEISKVHDIFKIERDD